MKLYNIQAGMLLVNKTGDRYIVLPFSGENDELYAYRSTDATRSALSRWDMNLNDKSGITDNDIMEVHSLESFQDLLSLEDLPTKLVWRRPNQAELLKQLQEIMLQMQSVMELLQ